MEGIEELKSTRRGSMAILGAALGYGLSGATSASATQTLLIPDRPMQLIWSLDHVFYDGARLSLLRSWAIEFRRGDNGVDIWGEESGVSADGSARLAEVVERERKRAAADFWPVKLSSGGLVLAAGTGGVGIGGQPSGAVALESLPDDLFYPSLGPIKSVQAIRLPDGRMGDFALEYEARSVPEKGWLDRAQRIATTRIGSTRETAIERWLMTDV